MCAPTARASPEMTIAMLPGPYRIPAYRAVCHFRLTNKTPAATYRAPGRFEGTFVRERLLDAIADRLGLDRVDGAPAQPDHRDGDAVYPAADARSAPRSSTIPATTRCCSTRRWRGSAGTRCRRICAAAAPPASWSAPASAIFVEKGGLGPLDGTRVSVDTTGAVELVTGGSSVGQGFATAMAQICADTLGVDYRRVRVVSGQTDRIQYGIGAHASRASVMTGGATHAAALKLRAKALDMAGALLQARARRARHRRRRGDPSRPARRPVDRARATSPGIWRPTRRRSASAIPGSPPKAGSAPST